MSIRDIINRSQQEKKRAQKLDAAKKVGAGIGIGAALGSILGVLFAPKAGKETREDIAQTAKATAGKIKEGAGEVGEKVQKVVEEGKERIGKIRKEKKSAPKVPEEAPVSKEE